MSKPVFIDTAALIAIGNKNDTFHLQALRINDELKQSNRYFITSSAVLLEFGSAFNSLNLRLTAIKLIEAIRESKRWKVVFVDEITLNKGLELFKRFEDKEWGLVDCTSIIIAKELGITEIFTTDHHFEQAGFKIFLNHN